MFFLLFFLDHSSAFLIISNRHSILVADLKEQGLERVPIAVENVVATSSNMHTGTIFWSDMKLKKISRLDRGKTAQDVRYPDNPRKFIIFFLFLLIYSSPRVHLITHIPIYPTEYNISLMGLYIGSSLAMM